MTQTPSETPATDQPALRMIAVHAHPDDESSKGAGTMARYVDEGVQVTVITCTGGERGSILNPKMENDPEALADLAALRRREMAEAQRILGVDHEWLGFVDSGLPEGDPVPPLPEGSFATLPVSEAARPLVAAIRRLRPQVMTTYDENGGYPHPDHIMCHRISVAAFEWAANPEYAPELGEPWEITKLYYISGFNRQRFAAVARWMRRNGRSAEELEKHLEHFDEDSDRLLTTRIDIRDFMEVRDDALRAHRTQVDPEGFFFSIGHDVQSEAWPTEDYELRTSRIGVTLPEDDLFAGLR